MVGSPKPTLFLSDLHLSPDRPAALRAFHAFARGPARDAAAVYMLGDIFDWWVGDDQVRIPFVADVVASMRTISDAGAKLCIGQGNRDFLIGERLARAAGATLLPEYLTLDLQGVRTLLCHGDQLCTDDVEYQAYRARMRDPEVQARLLRLPYLVRRVIAAWLRRKSRNTKALKAESIMDVAIPTVEQAFREHGATRMIHGHTHRPAVHAHVVDGVPRERIVLADWETEGRYLEVSEQGAVERTIAG
ncbi:MAG: UDP-2,3-diacylglucosamine diphosphatase [Burkholderiales bacterium]